MNPTNTPFSVQTVGARRRGPKRTIFKAYQTFKAYKTWRIKIKKEKKKRLSCGTLIDHLVGKKL